MEERLNKVNFVSKQQECYLLKKSLKTTLRNVMLQYVSWKTYILQFTYWFQVNASLIYSLAIFFFIQHASGRHSGLWSFENGKVLITYKGGRISR